ncbi:unnamed protein product, partial [Heterosigma akashiwo]
ARPGAPYEVNTSHAVQLRLKQSIRRCKKELHGKHEPLENPMALYSIFDEA